MWLRCEQGLPGRCIEVVSFDLEDVLWFEDVGPSDRMIEIMGFGFLWQWTLESKVNYELDISLLLHYL